MLILASNSPRRKQLLTLGGWEFYVVVPQVDETVLPGEAPADYVQRVALSKALGVLENPHFKLPDEAVILAADTAVVNPLKANVEVNGGSEILGKPASPEEAEAMLRKLRGRVHQVYTGLVVLRAADRQVLSELVITDVPMRRYSDEEIQAYIASGDPFDKAGAYAIQNPIFRPVENLKGCYANVMGLPVCQAARLLEQNGLCSESDIAWKCQWALGFPCEIFQQSLPGGDLALNDL
jgi:MAF protein